jgi:hypothetical protein
MNSRRQGLLWAGLLLLAGCAETDFSEDDSGRTIEVNQGSGFFVRLARVPAGLRPAPEIKGALIRPLEKKLDPQTNQEVYQFVAEGAGDAVIRIPPPDASMPEFVIQVHVLPSGKQTSSMSPSGKPPGSY